MAEAKKNILTTDGLKALDDELQELKVVRRKEIEKILKNAVVIDEKFEKVSSVLDVTYY